MATYSMTPSVLETDIAVVGGGPAGMILGLLLAQRGHRVTVLERNKDFAREYRGEVLMPRFIQMMRQIGLWDYLEKFPHLKLNGFELYLRHKHIATVDVAQISPQLPFILWMPQTVMLNALSAKASAHSNFSLRFGAHVHELIESEGVVRGVRATMDGQSVEVRAFVTVGADGRGSVLRNRGRFELEYDDHDFDLIWFTIPKPAGYQDRVRAFLSERHNYLILPKYPDLLQCGVLIKSGEYARYRREGIGSLKKELLEASPLFKDFAGSLKDFGPFTLLAAEADRLKDWAKSGLVMVGDAAHTCSPAGAIGVSVAVGTAIVAADVIDQALETKDFSHARLSEVQRLREREVKDIQRLQAAAARIVAPSGLLGRFFGALMALLIAKTGLLRRAQRRLMVAAKPLPIRTPSQGERLSG